MDTTLQSHLNAGLKALSAGMGEDALASLTEALHRARDTGSGHGEMLALGLLAPALELLGRRDEAAKAALKARGLSELHGDAESTAHYDGLAARLEGAEAADEAATEALTDEEINRAFERAGQALTMGQGREAVEVLTPLMASADQAGDKEVEASAAGMLAQAYLMTGYSHKAWELATHAVVLAKSLGDTQALQHFQELADSLGGKHSERAGEVLAESQLVAKITEQCARAGAALDEDRFDHAIRLLAEAAEEARVAGIRESEATARGFLAQAHLMAGDRPSAAKEAQAAIDLAVELDDSEATQSFRDVLKMASGWVKPKGHDA